MSDENITAEQQVGPTEVVRNVLPMPMGFQIIYCTGAGRYYGSVTIEAPDLEAKRNIAADVAEYVKTLTAKQIAVAGADTLGRIRRRDG